MLAYVVQCHVKVDHIHCGTSRIDNALVYPTLLKVLIDMDAYVYMKQWKEMQDGQA